MSDAEGVVAPVGPEAGTALSVAPVVSREIATAVQRTCTAVAAPAEAARHSTEDEIVARQKALFVAETWNAASSAGIPLREACHIVAMRTEQFPALVMGGHGGVSLLAGGRAWHNYRSWSTALGKLPGKRQPATDQWRSLLPKYRGSRGYVKPGAPEFWTILANLYEHPNRLSLRYAYKLAVMAYARAEETRPPSYDQAHHWYERYADQRAVTIAREGEEFARNHLVGYISREAPRVDECWFSDHHIFDAAVRVWDGDRGRWMPCRPWLTAWMDWGSLYFHGVIIRTCAPNRDSIERALRQGIEKNGRRPPIHLYIDNGKDYRSALKKSRLLDDADVHRVQSVGALLGCQTHFAIPYNARAKVIERIFGIVCGQFSKLWASYRGSNPQARPETADAQWNNPEGLPTLEQFTAAFEQWLAVVYHDSKSEGSTLQGKSPAEVREHASPLRDALEALDVYRAFLREIPGERTIQTGGTVRALNRWYESEALWRLVGSSTKVRVKVDPDNVNVAHIYTLDDREICTATQVKRLPGLVTSETPAETVEQIREGNARQRRRLKEIKAISAEARDLSRYRRATGPAVDRVFDLPAGTPAASARRLPAGPEDPQPIYASAADIAELDAALREQTIANRDALQGETIPADEFEAALRADAAERETSTNHEE